MEPQPGWDSALGLRIEELSATRVVGYVDIDERHHQGYGIVHGGVWASVVESIGSQKGPCHRDFLLVFLRRVLPGLQLRSP